MPDPLARNDAGAGPLFDQLPPPRRSTSTEAGQAAAMSSRDRYRRILDLLRDRGPMTLFELAAAMAIEPHRISGRITELKRDLLIERTGERRQNPKTGCSAEVLRLRVL